jgi:hypothetical protein
MTPPLSSQPEHPHFRVEEQLGPVFRVEDIGSVATSGEGEASSPQFTITDMSASGAGTSVTLTKLPDSKITFQEIDDSDRKNPLMWIADEIFEKTGLDIATPEGMRDAKARGLKITVNTLDPDVTWATHTYDDAPGEKNFALRPKYTIQLDGVILAEKELTFPTLEKIPDYADPQATQEAMKRVLGMATGFTDYITSHFKEPDPAVAAAHIGEDMFHTRFILGTTNDSAGNLEAITIEPTLTRFIPSQKPLQPGEKDEQEKEPPYTVNLRGALDWDVSPTPPSDDWRTHNTAYEKISKHVGKAYTNTTTLFQDRFRKDRDMIKLLDAEDFAAQLSRTQNVNYVDLGRLAITSLKKHESDFEKYQEQFTGAKLPTKASKINLTKEYDKFVKSTASSPKKRADLQAEAVKISAQIKDEENALRLKWEQQDQTLPSLRQTLRTLDTEINNGQITDPQDPHMIQRASIDAQIKQHEAVIRSNVSRDLMNSSSAKKLHSQLQGIQQKLADETKRMAAETEPYRIALSDLKDSYNKVLRTSTNLNLMIQALTQQVEQIDYSNLTAEDSEKLSMLNQLQAIQQQAEEKLEIYSALLTKIGGLNPPAVPPPAPTP